MATLYLIRGLPGTGKSTYAKTLNIPVFEADDWFTDADGIYRFVPTELAAAHKNCLMRVIDSLRAQQDCAVANTFTAQWEAQPYINYCRNYNHMLVVVTMTIEYGSIHNIHPETMNRMRERFLPNLHLD